MIELLIRVTAVTAAVAFLVWFWLTLISWVF